MTVLETQALTIGYPQDIVIAADLSLALEAGEIVCLVGPNGAGKSTLMRTLAGMQPPLRGGVLLDGAETHRLPPRQLAKHLSVVLTARPDVGLLTGYDVVALGRHPYTNWLGRLSAHDWAMVEWAVQAVSAEVIAAQPFRELSDGQRQKILIARALAQEPTVMLLDEPTAFLDLPRRVEVMQLLKQVAQQTQRAVLLSTHDLDLALHTADRVWLMSGGAVQVGAPEDLILDGTFEAAFKREGVQFDSHTGNFHIPTTRRRTLGVSGEGLPYRWTKHALERAGYTVEPAPDAAADVRIEDCRWYLAGQPPVDNIYDLLRALKLR